jgi:hypothetical protein
VALQLEDVLAGEGMRRGKVEQQAARRSPCRRCQEAARVAMRAARRRLPLSAKAIQQPGTRDPDDPDAAATGAVAMAAMVSLAWSGLAVVGGFPPLSIIRVICHCWAIDRMLLTTQ